MLSFLTRTTNSFAPTILRVVLGGIMLPHGCQKAFGMFGGAGWKATVRMFTHGMHVPPALAWAVIVTEFAGSICLISGFLTRIWSIGFIVLMSTAIAKVHLANGLFMNWTGSQKGEGFEFHILVIGMALALIVMGGGKFSVDASLGGSRGPKPAKSSKPARKDD